MRLLYLRHANRGARHRATAPGRGRAPDPGRAFRQSVPVHGISGHHQRGGKRGRGAPVETHGRHIRGGGAASSFSCLRADGRSRAAVDNRTGERARRGTYGLDTVRGEFCGGEIAGDRMGDVRGHPCRGRLPRRGRVDRARREYREGKDADKARSDPGRLRRLRRDRARRSGAARYHSRRGQRQGYRLADQG